MDRILLIIPAYNEVKNIEKVITKIEEEYSEFDYIIINDGSKDGTKELCEEKKYNIINLPVNLGLEGAFQTGIKYAYENDYDYAIQYDADGQHRPEYISEIYAKIKEDYDIVIGSRFVKEKRPASARMIGSVIISAIIRMTTGKKITDPTSGMRMFNRRMMKEFALNLNYGPEPDTISYLIKQGAAITECQVTMDERTEGESYLTLVRSLSYMVRMVFSILIIQGFRKRI